MIQEILITSLFIIGIHVATRAGMILGRVSIWMDLNVPYKWQKPLTECPPCMASFHGLYMAFVLSIDLPLIPVFIIAVSGLNWILANLAMK